MQTRGSMDQETDISSDEDEVPEKTVSTLEHERTSSERHGFLFQHNLSFADSDLSNMRPLPSQIPFLLNVYSENIHVFMRIVDISIITKMIRDLRGNNDNKLTPANEALMFSIYYATVTSMEEDEVSSPELKQATSWLRTHSLIFALDHNQLRLHQIGVEF